MVLSKDQAKNIAKVAKLIYWNAITMYSFYGFMNQIYVNTSSKVTDFSVHWNFVPSFPVLHTMMKLIKHLTIDKSVGLQVLSTQLQPLTLNVLMKHMLRALRHNNQLLPLEKKTSIFFITLQIIEFIQLPKRLLPALCICYRRSTL